MENLNGQEAEKRSEGKTNSHCKQDWGMYKEREFIENLFCQRFNYFILAYTIFVMATANIASGIGVRIILISGIVTLFFLWLTLCRAYIKLFAILKILRQEDGGILRTVDKIVDDCPPIVKLFSGLSIMAYALPFICIVSLFFLLFFGWDGFKC